ncbi:MAG: S8 family serine peptidase [Desulfobacteraceae bacterium]|jgi:hypothetical protein|nr:S8 family serine peptidase [Desulfobacteraceae bacterium]
MNNRLFLIFTLILIYGLPLHYVFAASSSGMGTELSPALQQQIKILSQEKADRTPAQKKMDSQLIYALKIKHKDPVMNSLPMLRASVDIDPEGTVLVDITATVTDDLLTQIRDIGGTVINSFVKYNAVRARLPLDAIETLADNPDIRFIRPAVRALLNKVNTSEGDVAHSAPIARSTYHVDGTDIKVGVMSDSVDYLAAVQATGDLPTVTVLEDAPGNSGEGTAMLEIVYDLAPAAKLYFATAWTGPAGFATNIEALADAGCDIIVDDIYYYNESPFQDDIISQAVNTVTANGVLYFSSAGNAGNYNDGTSGTWEGDYNGVANTNDSLYHDSIHDFGGGDTLNRITNSTNSFFYTLFWADPLGGAGNDYDFYVVSPDGSSIIMSAENVQDGNDDPYEAISATGDPQDYQIIIAKWSGADVFIHFSTNRGLLELNTTGQMSGHPCAVDAFAVAAVSANGKTDAFTGSESVESFSSDGPRRVFFNSNGTAITPGDFSSTGGTLRQKPDIAAADGVMCATPGFNPFYGTSAAAPHTAAIAALMLEANNTLTIADVKDAFSATAFDIEGSGWDRDSGYGLIMADALISYISHIEPEPVIIGPAVD